MEINRITNLIGSARYKLAPNTNTNIQLDIEEITKPISEYNFVEIVNAQNIFDDERTQSKKYRLNGKFNIYTSNVFTTGATTSVWDPMFYGNPPVAPSNWVMQITYPSTMNPDFKIIKRSSNGNIESIAYRGFQYKSLGVSLINGDNYLTISGVQNHNLVEGDYIYLYSVNAYNPLQGLHRVKNTGISGNNFLKDITLETIINPTSVPTIVGNFVKIVNSSFNDTVYYNPSNVVSAILSDISGNTSGVFTTDEPRYIKIKSLSHGLAVNNFVDIRVAGISILNGVWRVYSIPDQDNFVIRVGLDFTNSITPTSNKGFVIISPVTPTWRQLDGTPSEYYVRNFEVLTSNDYSVYPCAFSSNTYSDSKDPKIGIANGTWLFQFNQDINIQRLVDNRNAELSQFYYGVSKRSGRFPYNWSDVTSDWDFNFNEVNTQNYLEKISKYTPAGIGTIEKSTPRSETLNSNGDLVVTTGSTYIGDFTEYNSLLIEEKTISEIIHRFGLNTNPNGEGYYYKPFKKLDIRKYSTIVYTANPDEYIPDLPGNYVTNSDGTISWKYLLPIGFYEEGTNGVDYPFLNGAQYYYFDFNLYVRRQIFPNTTIPPQIININEGTQYVPITEIK